MFITFYLGCSVIQSWVLEPKRLHSWLISEIWWSPQNMFLLPVDSPGCAHCCHLAALLEETTWFSSTPSTVPGFPCYCSFFSYSASIQPFLVSSHRRAQPVLRGTRPLTASSASLFFTGLLACFWISVSLLSQEIASFPTPALLKPTEHSNSLLSWVLFFF